MIRGKCGGASFPVYMKPERFIMLFYISPDKSEFPANAGFENNRFRRTCYLIGASSGERRAVFIAG
jgi:hypothetical protein